MHEAATLGAEQVLGGDAGVLEDEFGGVLRGETDLVELAASAETGGVALDDDERETFRPRVRVGAAHHDDEIGVDSVGDERLLAVDHPLVTVAYGGGLHALQVGSGSGLGHRDRADTLTGGHLRQPAGLLLLCAEVHDVRDRDVVLQCESGAERGRSGACDLLLHDVPEPVVGHARAAEFLRRSQTDDAGLTRGDPRRPVDEALLLPLLVVRFDLAGEELANGLPVRLVIVVEMGALQGVLLKGQAFTRDIMPVSRSAMRLSASATMRSTSSPAGGMSWMMPCTVPTVQIPASGSPFS